MLFPSGARLPSVFSDVVRVSNQSKKTKGTVPTVSGIRFLLIEYQYLTSEHRCEYSDNRASSRRQSRRSLEDEEEKTNSARAVVASNFWEEERVMNKRDRVKVG